MHACIHSFLPWHGHLSKPVLPMRHKPAYPKKDPHVFSCSPGTTQWCAGSAWHQLAEETTRLRFPWCKYSHCGWLQASNGMSLKVNLGRCVSPWSSRVNESAADLHPIILLLSFLLILYLNICFLLSYPWFDLLTCSATLSSILTSGSFVFITRDLSFPLLASIPPTWFLLWHLASSGILNRLHPETSVKGSWIAAIIHKVDQLELPQEELGRVHS